MKTLRGRFPMRSNDTNNNADNANHNHNTPLTADLEGMVSGAHDYASGKVHDDKDEDHHDHDDDLLSLTAAKHNQNTGSHPHPYQILLRLRRLLLLLHRRLWNLVNAHPRTCKAIIILLCLTIAVQDPPFYVYPYIIAITIAVQSVCWPCHTWRWRHTCAVLLPIYLILWMVFHHFAVTREVQRVRSHRFDISAVNKSRHFYYMQPNQTDYAKLIKQIAAISEFVNRPKDNKLGTTNSTTAASDMNMIEPLPVKSVKLFDNAIRFDFLLEFIHNDDFTADFACLIESDVVIHTQYFTEEWYKQQQRGVEFAYVQHAWGRTDFEAQSVGCLCVSKTASYGTIRWLKMMSYLNDRRYCRLLIGPAWMGLPAKKKHVFAWDLSGGCTVLRPYCHYIHFTRPKGPALDAAMTIVQRGSFDVNYNI